MACYFFWVPLYPPAEIQELQFNGDQLDDWVQFRCCKQCEDVECFPSIKNFEEKENQRKIENQIMPKLYPIIKLTSVKLQLLDLSRCLKRNPEEVASHHPLATTLQWNR